MTHVGFILSPLKLYSTYITWWYWFKTKVNYIRVNQPANLQNSFSQRGQIRFSILLLVLFGFFFLLCYVTFHIKLFHLLEKKKSYDSTPLVQMILGKYDFFKFKHLSPNSKRERQTDRQRVRERERRKEKERKREGGKRQKDTDRNLLPLYCRCWR